MCWVIGCKNEGPSHDLLTVRGGTGMIQDMLETSSRYWRAPTLNLRLKNDVHRRALARLSCLILSCDSGGRQWKTPPTVG